MKAIPVYIVLILVVILIGSGCANIVPPSGGKKDVTPPKLLSVTPKDSLLNTRVRKIELRFNEFITLSNASKEVQISPLLPIPLTVTSNLRKVTVSIPDTMLMENTTYRISFGKAIQDLNEGNAFAGYNYMFSTGGYFDSLKISGDVFNASTGLPDTGAFVLLYDAKYSDSIVVKQKPLYIALTDGGGHFKLDGLPAHQFRIFALHDKNSNLIYDGGGEWIAFNNEPIQPHKDSVIHVALNVFPEGKDTTADKKIRDRKNATTKTSNIKTEGISYQVFVDTSDLKRRTVELTKPVEIIFNKPALINNDRIFLSYDSNGAVVEAQMKITADTADASKLHINTDWRQNTVYTLRLLKGFAKDSTGKDAMPSKYIFRTKREEDYAKLRIHLPSKYAGKKFVLQVSTEQDTIYQKPVADTMVNFAFLQPANYTIRVIKDDNENGVWDSGNLFERKQPEIVIPYTNTIQLKAGWENIIDFEEVKKKVKMGAKEQ